MPTLLKKSTKKYSTAWLIEQAFETGLAERKSPSKWKDSLRFIESHRKHPARDKIQRAYRLGKSAK